MVRLDRKLEIHDIAALIISPTRELATQIRYDRYIDKVVDKFIDGRYIQLFTV